MEKVTRPELRKVIRAAMRERGIRYINGSRGLAETAGVTRNTIYNWEGGVTAPALDELEKVAIALGLPLSHLVDAWSGRQSKEAAPDWGRLTKTIEAIAVKLKVSVGDDLPAARALRAARATTDKPGGDGAPRDPKRPAPARE